MRILVIEVLCLRRDVPAVFVMQADVPLHVFSLAAVRAAAATATCASASAAATSASASEALAWSAAALARSATVWAWMAVAWATLTKAVIPSGGCFPRKRRFI